MVIYLPDVLLPKVKHFGLSIGRETIRAVELTQAGGVYSYAEVSFHNELFANGALVDATMFIEGAKKLMEVGKFSSPYATISFPERYAFTRGYTLPAIADSDVTEAISWHAKDIFPYPIEEIYYDWRTISKNDHEINVMIIAVPRTFIDGLVAALTKAGISPMRFEPDASALSHLIALPIGKFSLITEVNKNGAYVTLVEGEKALFTTILNTTVNEPVDERVTQLIATQKEILSFYERKEIIPKGGVPVIVTGEMATAELASKLAARSSYKTTLLETPMKNPAFNKAYAAAQAAIVAPQDAVTINLLPSSIQKTYDIERQLLYYKTILLRACVFLLFAGVFSITSFVVATLERSRLDNEVKNLTRLIQSQETQTQDLLQLNARAASIVTLSPLRVTPLTHLQALKSLLPSGISVSELSYDDASQTFTISGVALRRDDLLTFKSNLESSETFGRVTVPLESLETPVNVAFTTTFQVKK